MMRRAMLDTSLSQYKRDPKCNHGHGVGARPTMSQIRQVAPRDASGEVDAKLEREKEHLFLLLLLLLLLSRSRG
jgi:hypothetical protein